MADTLRIVALILTAAAAGLFPFAAFQQGRRNDAWFAIAGAEAIFLSVTMAILHSWGEPLVWWRTPLVGLADVLYLAFVWHVFRRTRLTS